MQALGGAAIAHDTQGLRRGTCRATRLDPYLPLIREHGSRSIRGCARRGSRVIRLRLQRCDARQRHTNKQCGLSRQAVSIVPSRCGCRQAAPRAHELT
jgi:hypothetical protein